MTARTPLLHPVHDATRAPRLQRKAAPEVRPAGDVYEREAERAAAQVAATGAARIALSRLPPSGVQREDVGAPKSEEDNYKEATGKLGDAFLKTDLGTRLKEAAAADPVVKEGISFVGTLPGKIITGAAAAGAVAALAALHKELPIQIPEIPLDAITPGLAVRIVYEGPVDQPTKATITFSYTEQAPKRPGAKTRAELQREENARIAADQARFRAGMRYAPGTPEARRQAADEEAVRGAAFSGVGRLPGFGAPLTPPTAARDGLQLQLPEIGAGRLRKPPRLLDQELHLDPLPTGVELPKKDREGAVQRKGGDGCGRQATPARVSEVLAAPGAPLDAAVRSSMEAAFGADFGRVRLHSDRAAAESARVIGATAYTSGNHVVFAQGANDPRSAAGRLLLAHELAHVVQQTGAAAADRPIQRQAQPGEAHADQGRQDAGPEIAPAAAGAGGASTAPGTPSVPRANYVFIMGVDDPRRGNPFYGMALAYYRAHLPSATFVTDQRDLRGVLAWLASHGADPIGELYIVAHANEDGTLSFGLDGADADRRLTVRELRDALHPASGPSTLPSVASRVDAATRINIKGCDIGRTQAMVELIDEAFAGAGTVTAPTHEQAFGTDPNLAAQARETFRAGVRGGHAAPPDVDPALRGRARTDAVAERRRAVRAREAAIAADLRQRAPEEADLVARAGHTASLSGPMFQRPGTQLFTPTELRTLVDASYGHLTAARRAALVTQLAAPDTRPAPADGRLSTVGQRGQRVDQWTTSFTFPEPRTAAEAMAVLRSPGVTLTSVAPATHLPIPGGETLQIDVRGTQTTGRGRAATRIPWSGSVTAGSQASPLPTEVELRAQALRDCPNPERYAWKFDERHSTGRTTRRVIGERVLAYVHHGSLDAGPHQPFAPPMSNPEFYATSTFAPPPPPSGGRP